jgi:hypothetical protein
MRIFIQQKETGLYFKDIDTWERESSKAMDFLSSTAALDFCIANKITGVQLVFKIEEGKYNIVLPVLPPETPSHAHRK